MSKRKINEVFNISDTKVKKNIFEFYFYHEAPELRNLVKFIQARDESKILEFISNNPEVLNEKGKFIVFYNHAGSDEARAKSYDAVHIMHILAYHGMNNVLIHILCSKPNLLLEKSHKQETLLSYAVLGGNEDTIDYLACLNVDSKRIDLNNLNKSQQNLLFLAALQDNAKLFKKLLQLKVHLIVPNTKILNKIYESIISYNSAELATVLLEYLKSKNNEGYTQYINYFCKCSVLSDKKELVELALKFGANPNFVFNDQNLLVLAYLKGNNEVADLLMQYGASPFLPFYKKSMNEFCNVISYFIEANNIDLAMQIIDKSLFRFDKYTITQSIFNIIKDITNKKLPNANAFINQLLSNKALFANIVEVAKFEGDKEMIKYLSGIYKAKELIKNSFTPDSAAQSMEARSVKKVLESFKYSPKEKEQIAKTLSQGAVKVVNEQKIMPNSTSVVKKANLNSDVNKNFKPIKEVESVKPNTVQRAVKDSFNVNTNESLVEKKDTYNESPQTKIIVNESLNKMYASLRIKILGDKKITWETKIDIFNARCKNIIDSSSESALTKLVTVALNINDYGMIKLLVNHNLKYQDQSRESYNVLKNLILSNKDAIVNLLEENSDVEMVLPLITRPEYETWAEKIKAAEEYITKNGITQAQLDEEMNLSEDHLNGLNGLNQDYSDIH
jgi:hypothetical protein